MPRRTTATTRTATPTAPASRRPVVGVEVKASRTRASTGRPSFAKLFQSPEISNDTEVRERENPHDVFMA
jgi:hypothetical protein